MLNASLNKTFPSFPNSSKGSFICTIPQTGQHITQPLVYQFLELFHPLLLFSDTCMLKCTECMFKRVFCVLPGHAECMFKCVFLFRCQGTLQKYIDDFFKTMLVMSSTMPPVIKYLFDFLDEAADKYGLTDQDIVHTWKCNRWAACVCVGVGVGVCGCGCVWVWVCVCVWVCVGVCGCVCVGVCGCVWVCVGVCGGCLLNRSEM